MRYNAEVLNNHAGRLLARARRIVWTATGIGVLVGLALASVTAKVYAAGEPAATYVPLILLVAGTAVGYARGRQQAEQLELSAHTILVQVQIEENTRRPL